MKSHIAACIVVFASAVPNALATFVYRSTMPDGKVIYGELPQPGAKQVRKVAPPPANTGIIVATPDELLRQPSGSSGPPASVTVVPMPHREPPAPHTQGRQSPRGVLPQRPY
jgi:hypothetical protein